MSADDHDRIMRIIMARCDDVLSEAEVSKFLDASTQPDPDDRLPSQIGEQILDVISHMTYTDSSMNTSWSS